MPPTRFSTLDLLDLPPLEREIVLCAARDGPVAADRLAAVTGHDPAAVSGVIARLVQDGRLHRLADGRIEVAFGRVGRRTTLPARLWPALLATDRPYSTQEIATLRVAIPILQFARARMTQFTDHGPAHALRVRSYAVQLAYLIGLTASERHLLRVGALFHDVGNVVDRDRHHLISQETVERLAADGRLPFSRAEAEVIGLLCRWHRREYDPDRVDVLRGEHVRTGLLASVLRVADAMDIDHRRADYDQSFKEVLRHFYPDQLGYWSSLEEIAGVRIRCAANVNLQVYTWGPVVDNIQIDMLRRDLAATPLSWSVEQVAVAGSAPRPATGRRPGGATSPVGRVLVAFPFDPHSLVMAALSGKHLAAAGAAVDVLCYPDLPEAPPWLWAEALAGTEPSLYDRLVIIGDRPDPNATPHLFGTVGRWREAGVAVSVLNRHEGNWTRLPGLLELGVDVVLGGDWAYFWGDAADPADLVWGRVASLCVRDPTLSTVGVTAQERAVTRGLLTAIYDALADPPANNLDDWRARAEPILARIAADDRAYFADQADRFAATYAAANVPERVQGRVVVFDRAPGAVPQSFPWILEAAIERHGRAPERGVRYNVPHAIATWPEGDAVELLAITHWREERTVPIRLLYPEDIGPPPQGNEHVFRVRVAAERAPVIVEALIAACNRA